MKNKLLVALMLISIIALYSFASATEIFSDLPKDHWSYNYVYSMVNTGIIKGYEDGTFRPGGNITKAEFAKILTEAFSLSTSGSATYEFEDVAETDWFYPYVNAASKYLTAYKQGDKLTFAPNSQAIREDMTVAMVMAMGKQNASYDESVLNKFSDVSKISPNLRKYVAIAYQNGYVSGYEDATFKPLGGLTRAETATLVAKTLEKEGKLVIDDWTQINPDPIEDIGEPPELPLIADILYYEEVNGALIPNRVEITSESNVESVKISKTGSIRLTVGYQEDFDNLAINYHEYYDKALQFTVVSANEHIVEVDPYQILEYDRIAREQFPIAKTGADPETRLTIKGANGNVLLSVAVELVRPTNPVPSIYITGVDYELTPIPNQNQSLGSDIFVVGTSTAAMGSAYFNGSAEANEGSTITMSLSRTLNEGERLVIKVDNTNNALAQITLNGKKAVLSGTELCNIARTIKNTTVNLTVFVNNNSDSRKLGTIKVTVVGVSFEDELKVEKEVNIPSTVGPYDKIILQLNRELSSNEKLVCIFKTKVAKYGGGTSPRDSGYYAGGSSNFDERTGSYVVRPIEYEEKEFEVSCSVKGKDVTILGENIRNAISGSSHYSYGNSVSSTSSVAEEYNVAMGTRTSSEGTIILKVAPKNDTTNKSAKEFYSKELNFDLFNYREPMTIKYTLPSPIKGSSTVKFTLSRSLGDNELVGVLLNIYDANGEVSHNRVLANVSGKTGSISAEDLYLIVKMNAEDFLHNQKPSRLELHTFAYVLRLEASHSGGEISYGVSADYHMGHINEGGKRELDPNTLPVFAEALTDITLSELDMANIKVSSVSPSVNSKTKSISVTSKTNITATLSRNLTTIEDVVVKYNYDKEYQLRDVTVSGKSVKIPCSEIFEYMNSATGTGEAHTITIIVKSSFEERELATYRLDSTDLPVGISYEDLGGVGRNKQGTATVSRTLNSKKNELFVACFDVYNSSNQMLTYTLYSSNKLSTNSYTLNYSDLYNLIEKDQANFLKGLLPKKTVLHFFVIDSTKYDYLDDKWDLLDYYTRIENVTEYVIGSNNADCVIAEKAVEVYLDDLTGASEELDISDIMIVTNLESPLTLYSDSTVKFELNRALRTGEQLKVYLNAQDYYSDATFSINGKNVSVTSSALSSAYSNWKMHLITPAVVGYQYPSPVMKVAVESGSQRKELASVDLVFSGAKEIGFNLSSNVARKGQSLTFTTTRSLDSYESFEAEVVVYNRNNANVSKQVLIATSRGNNVIGCTDIFDYIYSDEVQEFLGGNAPSKTTLRLKVVSGAYSSGGYSTMGSGKGQSTVVASKEFVLVLEGLDELSMVSHGGSLDSNFTINFSRAPKSSEAIKVYYGYYPMTGFSEVPNVTISGNKVIVPGSVIQDMWFVKDPMGNYLAVMANHTIKVEVIENGSARELGSFVIGDAYGTKGY